MRGTASPPSRRGSTPPETMGSCPPVARSFSPARLRAVGAGPPAHHAGGPSPLALRRARRPGLRAPRTAPRETIASARHFTMPAARPACGPPRLPAPPVARTTQASARAANKRKRPPVALDKLPLTLVSGQSSRRKAKASLSHTTRPLASFTTPGSSEPISPRPASSKSPRSSNGRLFTLSSPHAHRTGDQHASGPAGNSGRVFTVGHTTPR